MKPNFRTNVPVSLGDYPIPSSAEAEEQIIADVINSPEGFSDYRKLVKEDYFSDPENRAIWKRLCGMHDSGEEISLLSLVSVAGKDFVNRITEKPVATEFQALSHCKSLASISRRRSMYTAASDLLIAASTGGANKEAEQVAFDRLSQSFNETTVGNDWKSTIFDYTANVKQPDPLLLCCGVPIATAENLTVISGKPKVCKTTLQSAIIAACLTGGSVINFSPASPFFRILLADTEQSDYYLSKQCDRIFRMAGTKKEDGKGAFEVLNLRPYTPQERFEFIKKAVEEFRPNLLFIDGSADLIEDTNDLQLSERLVSDLLTLSSKYDLGIVTVVHSNPGGEGKIRGHLGSCLERKAETVISLEREGLGESIKVKARQARNRPFDAFSITINDQGDPELVSPDESPRTAEDWLIFLMVPGKEYSNSELVGILAEKGFKKSASQYGIKASLQNGRIVQKDGLYSLRLSDDNGNSGDMPDI